MKIKLETGKKRLIHAQKRKEVPTGKATVVSIQKGRAEHIFHLCKQICLHEHGEDWCDESHLINMSGWRSVSGPAGGSHIIRGGLGD